MVPSWPETIYLGVVQAIDTNDCSQCTVRQVPLLNQFCSCLHAVSDYRKYGAPAGFDIYQLVYLDLPIFGDK